MSTNFIRWFDEIGIGDVGLVGGKNASLGEMYRELVPRGINVPEGFAITAQAYWHFLGVSGAGDRVDAILRQLKPGDVASLEAVGRQLRSAILEAPLPPELETAISDSYGRLVGSGPGDVAVRSSATAEDLPGASFAGQQETFLNVQGGPALLDACRRCFASLYTDRAITYREKLGFDQRKVALSIGVQRMVRSDQACSGVMFTLDTETGFRDVILIEAAYGLGENVVQGIVDPDEFCVFKTTLREGYEPILEKRLGGKELKLVYEQGGTRQVKNVPVTADARERFALSDSEILTLARWGAVIEDHYSTKLGHLSPMDIEWAKDGRDGKLFIVQARPETVHSRKDRAHWERFTLKAKGKLLLSGCSVGDRIGQGPARVIEKLSDLKRVRPGDVLVTAKTDPDWEPYMKKVAAIVTDHGGRTCHAAIVSRELGIPAVVGTGNGTSSLKDGEMVTVSCAEGETGYVYQGALAFEKETLSTSDIPRPRTRVMLNIGNPEVAFQDSFIPNDGVGLARMEFIISNHIRIHPMALVGFEKIEDLKLRSEIETLTRGYTEKTRYFVEKLAMGIGRIGAAFYPKDVIVRFSDFKTNEYANLIGGAGHEPREENPMLGFRGASRYYHPLYREAFGLECAAIRRVRETMGLTNVKVMIPFCRTPEEGRRVLEEMRGHGLERGRNGLEVYVMCEIPSNVILAREYALLFDGFSIGSNDLTQLVLGVDRDSSLIAPLFDEQDPAVKTMIASMIDAAKQAGRKVGICGQAPSDFPEFTEFLIARGIDSISLNPDAAIRMSFTVARAEALLSIVA